MNLDEETLEEFTNLFVEFLCKNNCLFEYLENLKAHPHFKNTDKTIRGAIAFMIFNNHLDEWVKLIINLRWIINYSFMWNETKQTQMFWAELEQKFLDYYIETEFYKKNVKL